MDRIVEQLETAWQSTLVHLGSQEFYSQIGFVIVAVCRAVIPTTASTALLENLSLDSLVGCQEQGHGAAVMAEQVGYPRMVAVQRASDDNIHRDIGQRDVEWCAFVRLGLDALAFETAARGRRGRRDRDIMGGSLAAMGACGEDNQPERDQNKGVSRHSKL